VLLRSAHCYLCLGVARLLLGQGHRLTVGMCECRSTTAATANCGGSARTAERIRETRLWGQPYQLRRPRHRFHTKQQARRGGDLTDLLDGRCFRIGCDKVDNVDKRIA
jgi:hypothetical protein